MPQSNPADAAILDRLFATIAARKSASPETSYTASLLQDGVERCARKFGEESLELVLAAATGNKTGAIAESADVLYHLLVLWAALNITPYDVYSALAAREGTSGIAEKAARKKS
jgi:phosphoribosyl-ATP pyrophosphohydrolase